MLDQKIPSICSEGEFCERNCCVHSDDLKDKLAAREQSLELGGDHWTGDSLGQLTSGETSAEYKRACGEKFRECLQLEGSPHELVNPCLFSSS